MMGKDKHSTARFGLLAGAVLLASLTGAKVAKCFFEPQRAEGVVAYAAGQNEHDPNRVQPFLDQTREAATVLKDKNLFVLKPPRAHPVNQVDGILGREVLIAGKWYKVGDCVGDAKIISIDSTEAIVEWDGQEKSFAPLVAISNKPVPDPKVTVEKTPDVEKGGAAAVPVEVKVATVTVEETATEDDPLGWIGMDLSPEMRAKIMEKWSSASDEQKQQIKDRWSNMSAREKEEALQSLD